MSEESGATGAGELGPYAEKVLDAVDLIPPGRVMTYGDVAEWLGEGGPRQVGRVMAEYGAVVPWWRVVRSDGVLLAGHEQRALAAYRAEGTPLRTVGPAAQGHIPRLDMRAARWDGLSPDGTRTPDGPGRAPGAGPEGAPGSAGGASGG